MFLFFWADKAGHVALENSHFFIYSRIHAIRSRHVNIYPAKVGGKK